MKQAFILGALTLMAVADTTRAANPIVVMDTSMGTIKIELYEDKAPITVKNFLNYVDNQHYDGRIFHRVIDGFMIQGGGYDKDFKEGKLDRPIKNEASNGLKNEHGTIAMARTDDPDSATAQFFINVKDNTSLNHTDSKAGYCVFGRVIEGMDVVDKIRQVETGAKGPFRTDCPKTDVVIKSVKRAK